MLNIIMSKMEQRNLKLTLEQAKSLLETNQDLQEIIYNSFPELKPKTIVPDSWESLEKIEGFYVDTDSAIRDIYDFKAREGNRLIATTEKHCLSMLAFAQLSQLMKATGDCDVDWNNECTDKFIIDRFGHELGSFYCQKTYCYLAFKTQSVRDEFLQKHEELIKQYFMI